MGFQGNAMSYPTTSEIRKETETWLGKYVYIGGYFHKGRRPKNPKAENVGKVVEVKVEKRRGWVSSSIKVFFPVEGYARWVKYGYNKSSIVGENGKYVDLIRDPDSIRKALKRKRKEADDRMKYIEELEESLKRNRKYVQKLNDDCDTIEDYLTDVLENEVEEYYVDEDGNRIPEENLVHYQIVK